MVSDIIFHVGLRNYPLLSFGIVLKVNFYNYIKKAIKIYLPFPSIYMRENSFFKNTSTKTTCHNRLKAEVYMRA